MISHNHIMRMYVVTSYVLYSRNGETIAPNCWAVGPAKSWYKGHFLSSTTVIAISPLSTDWIPFLQEEALFPAVHCMPGTYNLCIAYSCLVFSRGVQMVKMLNANWIWIMLISDFEYQTNIAWPHGTALCIALVICPNRTGTTEATNEAPLCTAHSCARSPSTLVIRNAQKCGLLWGDTTYFLLLLLLLSWNTSHDHKLPLELFLLKANY